MENNNEKNKQSFWKDKKNVAIVILAVLLFIMPMGQTTDTNEINNLKNEISSLTQNITSLETEVSNLKSKNTKLEEEKERIEKENNQLKETISSNQDNSTNTLSNETESTSTSSQPITQIEDNSEKTSEMVWVGNTGTKYHTQNCRTLKGNGHQITMQQALAEGKQACKVCH